MKKLFGILTFGMLIGLGLSNDCDPVSEFECENQRCIPSRFACDGDNDCSRLSGDWSDEPPLINPDQCPACLEHEFRCKSGKCIVGTNICDKEDNCGDGSDEAPPENPDQCPPCPANYYYQCASGKCIRKLWACDGIDNCGDMSDEPGDPNQCPACDEDEYRCTTGRCVPTHYVCNGDRDCSDGSDEPGNPDECPACSDEQFRCTSGRCIPNSQKCDWTNDCTDWRDEREDDCPCADNEIRCNKLPPPPGEGQAPGICIQPEYWCDEEGIWDCPDGSDEANCTTTINHDSNRKENVLRRDYKTKPLLQAKKLHKPNKRI